MSWVQFPHGPPMNQLFITGKAKKVSKLHKGHRFYYTIEMSLNEYHDVEICHCDVHLYNHARDGKTFQVTVEVEDSEPVNGVFIGRMKSWELATFFYRDNDDDSLIVGSL